MDRELVSREVVESPSWSQLQDVIGNRQLPNTGVIAIKRAEAVRELSQMFGSRPDFAWSPTIEFDLGPCGGEADDYAELLDIPPDQDERESAVKAVMVSRGQPSFRRGLLENYRHCLVTRWRVPAVLEAAHISPYRGTHTDTLRNGHCCVPTSTRSSTSTCSLSHLTTPFRSRRAGAQGNRLWRIPR